MVDFSLTVEAQVVLVVFAVVIHLRSSLAVVEQEVEVVIQLVVVNGSNFVLEDAFRLGQYFLCYIFVYASHILGVSPGGGTTSSAGLGAGRLQGNNDTLVRPANFTDTLSRLSQISMGLCTSVVSLFFSLIALLIFALPFF